MRLFLIFTLLYVINGDINSLHEEYGNNKRLQSVLKLVNLTHQEMLFNRNRMELSIARVHSLTLNYPEIHNAIDIAIQDVIAATNYQNEYNLCDFQHRILRNEAKFDMTRFPMLHHMFPMACLAI